ncbi:MAG: VWA domain-containing protein [Actinomycetota bacterium]|nr:VWA domain-containing protein [Actinomycetota bacterium]
MTFLWPAMLLALLAVPVLVAGYVSLQRRRARQSAELTASGLSMTGAGGQVGPRRHVPFALLLASVAVMLFAVARPQATLATPRRTGTVVLAFDVSNSMLADDIEPTRIVAAQNAARAFVEAQPSTIEIGIVAFGDGALVTQVPTKERADVLAAIDRLTPSGRTSLGQGILSSMSAIAGKPIALPDGETQNDTQPGNVEYFGSATVVLLSDGENTGGPDPIAAAELAANAGLHISTIGIGSQDGAVIEVDGFQVATVLDAELLTDIAENTGGTYYAANDAASLDEIYRSIDLRIAIEDEKTEITGLVAGAAIALMIAGGLLMMHWFGRIV